jgi:hypothetical protein
MRPERKPSIPHHKYKLSAAQRTQAAFSQLCTVLKKEWSSIRALNLGVKSGTGVIDDVLITQLHQLASAVHLLAVTDADASRLLVAQACKLSTQQFQNLQVRTTATSTLGMIGGNAAASLLFVFTAVEATGEGHVHTTAATAYG